MILNIAAYQFTSIADPSALAQQLREQAQKAALLGTVLIAGEGINLFLAGEPGAIRQFIAGLREDSRFVHIQVKESRSEMQPFARLKVKVKDEIISFRQDESSPLAGRAPAVSPAKLARWIEQGHDDDGRRVVLLDTRNREEVLHGTFVGALSLPIDKFTQLPEVLTLHGDALADATVVTFCTGGIRCEKAALWLQASGIDRVWQLDGGILNYFEQVGGYGYEGHCFVFDERIALDPALRPLVDADAVGVGA
ncbi:MAG: sulfurtransferase [Dokdonella sp.]